MQELFEFVLMTNEFKLHEYSTNIEVESFFLNLLYCSIFETQYI